jgi:hypothetical protein
MLVVALVTLQSLALVSVDAHECYSMSELRCEWHSFGDSAAIHVECSIRDLLKLGNCIQPSICQHARHEQGLCCAWMVDTELSSHSNCRLRQTQPPTLGAL